MPETHQQSIKAVRIELKQDSFRLNRNARRLYLQQYRKVSLDINPTIERMEQKLVLQFGSTTEFQDCYKQIQAQRAATSLMNLSPTVYGTSQERVLDWKPVRHIIMKGRATSWSLSRDGKNVMHALCYVEDKCTVSEEEALIETIETILDG